MISWAEIPRADRGTRQRHQLVKPLKSGASFSGRKHLFRMAPAHAGTHMINNAAGLILQRRDGENTVMTDFSTITACGECCTACPKKLDGRCPGCIEADGRVPEWAESGRCRIHACTRDHHAQFCGLCGEFPCARIPSLIPWNPGVIEHLTALRDEYRELCRQAGEKQE